MYVSLSNHMYIYMYIFIYTCIPSGGLRAPRVASQEVNSKDCPECMVGPVAETVGYLAPGASADYAYSAGSAIGNQQKSIRY